jgi:hypothetical protein
MEIVLYRTEDDNVTVSALIKDEMIWLTQKAMAELFEILFEFGGKSYIKHIQSSISSVKSCSVVPLNL